MKSFKVGILLILTLASSLAAARFDYDRGGHVYLGDGPEDFPPTWDQAMIATCSVETGYSKMAMALVVDRLTEDTLETLDPKQTTLVADVRHFNEDGQAKLALAEYRLEKLKCIARVVNGHFGGVAKIYELSRDPDLLNALNNLMAWGNSLREIRAGFCPLEPASKRPACVSDVIERFRRDAELGWAMQKYATDLKAALIHFDTRTLFGFSKSETNYDF